MPKMQKWEIVKLPTTWCPEFRGLGNRVNLNGQEPELFIRQLIKEHGEGSFTVKVTITVIPDR